MWLWVTCGMITEGAGPSQAQHPHEAGAVAHARTRSSTVGDVDVAMAAKPTARGSSLARPGAPSTASKLWGRVSSCLHWFRLRRAVSMAASCNPMLFSLSTTAHATLHRRNSKMVPQLEDRLRRKGQLGLTAQWGPYLPSAPAFMLSANTSCPASAVSSCITHRFHNVQRMQRL